MNNEPPLYNPDDPTRATTDDLNKPPPPPIIQELADKTGGTVTDHSLLPDGSGCATVSYSLLPTHWIYGPDDKVSPHGFKYYAPPMPFRMGRNHPLRYEWDQKIRAAARYAIRASTDSGKDQDFDPDAMVGNFVVGMLGYWSETGLTGIMEDAEYSDPNPAPPEYPRPDGAQAATSAVVPEPQVTAAERRETLAGMAMQGLLSRAEINPPANTTGHYGGASVTTYADSIALNAVLHADALLRMLAMPAPQPSVTPRKGNDPMQDWPQAAKDAKIV
jgi:hypothetical protein